MASIKIVLRKKINKDGTYPLAIRITKDRRTSFIHLGYHVKETEWDGVTQKVRKSHPNSTRLNNFLMGKLAEATDKSLEIETQKKEVSSRAVKQKIKPTGGSTFFAQADIYLANLKQAGKYNRYTTDKSRVKHFRAFLNDSDIAFSDITIPLLEKFQSYLKGVLNVGQRTVINHLMMIRSVFSQAMKGEITDRKYYPFGQGKIGLKFPDSTKVGLTADEVKRIEEAELPEQSFENHCRNLWLFSFYFAGMRVSDVLRIKWTDIQNDRLHYTMGKNKKGGSFKIAEKALAIINQYQDRKSDTDDFIFPDLKKHSELTDAFLFNGKISRIIGKVDKALREKVAPAAKIQKTLTMHIARHTFGNISGDRIPLQMLQKLYRHSSITTTVGYQANFIHKDADEALTAVIGF
jgi:integrase/recombinase XerD